MNNLAKVSEIFNSVFGKELMIPWDASRSGRLFDEIKTETYSPNLIGHIPHSRQSIIGMYSLIPQMYSVADEVVVFAIDSISYEYFATTIVNALPKQNSGVGILSSVFPSTTGSAWHSMIYGASPSHTGAYGTSFLHEKFNRNYVWIGNSLHHKSSRSTISSDTEVKINLAIKPTVFELLRQFGVDSFYFGTHGIGEFNPFRNELTRGATFIEPVIPNYDHLKKTPAELMEYFFRHTSFILNSNKQKKLIWNYVNLDAYIHEHGYELLTGQGIWQTIFDYCLKKSSQRRAFVLVSDHGQTPQTKLDINILRLSENFDGLEYNTGGAGRTLYFYPKAGKKAEVKAWLEKLVGETGLILEKQELIEYGLLESDAIALDRIGGFIAIATSPDFPSAGAHEYINEHGSLTAAEMFVPIIIVLGD